MLNIRRIHIIKRAFKGNAKYCSKSKKPANISSESAAPEEVTKESLQWRVPWAEKNTQWYSKLKVFSSDHNNTDVIKFLSSPINLSPSAIKAWWQRRQLEIEIIMQSYIPERNKILGNDLAAAHFIVHRNGAVKFVGDNNWIKQDENFEYKLPNRFVADLYVEAIDCSNMNLHYEGLANLKGLQKLKWLSLNNCQYMDDWCLDRICFLCRDSLEYLDIRNCKNISERGIGALYKLTKLKTLYVDSITSSVSLELTCLMLQEIMPKLEIKE